MGEGAGEVEAAVAALYQLPLAEFVAARDALARRLRAAGDRQAAARVAGLRRPSVSTWAANQLGRVAPETVTELLEAGAALHAAQREALAGKAGAARALRRAAAEQRAAIGRLTQRAETLLARAGHAASDPTLRRLAATLQAAATADPATRAALAEGRLPGDLDPAGFGLPADAAPVEDAQGAVEAPAATAPPPPPAGQPTRLAEARRAAIRAVERAGRAAERATAALDEAERHAARQQQAAAAVRQGARDLARAAEELAERATQAGVAAEQARDAAEAAERQAEVAAERVGLARDAADVAAAAHAAARAALDGLP